MLNEVMVLLLLFLLLMIWKIEVRDEGSLESERLTEIIQKYDSWLEESLSLFSRILLN